GGHVPGTVPGTCPPRQGQRAASAWRQRSTRKQPAAIFRPGSVQKSLPAALPQRNFRGVGQPSAIFQRNQPQNRCPQPSLSGISEGWSSGQRFSDQARAENRCPLLLAAKSRGDGATGSDASPGLDGAIAAGCLGQQATRSARAAGCLGG